MACEEEKLNRELMNILGEPIGLAGVPLLVVERRLKEAVSKFGCDTEQLQKVIQNALDNWVIDKTIDELTYAKKREFDIPDDEVFTWHLKILSHKDAEAYRELKPEGQALIRLLREQNDTHNLGSIIKNDAARILSEQGFTDTEHIFAGYNVRSFMTSGSDDWWYGLIQEYEKTEEYHQWQEKIAQKHAEKEYRYMLLVEECEITDPIYGHLEDLGIKREDDMDKLWDKKDKMSEEEWIREKEIIESRDVKEEELWESIMNMTRELSYDNLIKLQGLFKDKLPGPDKVLQFLKEMGA